MFEAIIVTGTPFSGKTTLAKLLANHFNWKYFSVGQMWRDAWRKRVPNGDTGFENFMDQLKDEEHVEMDKRARDYISQGHIVGDLRHAFLHRDPQILIVYTRCDIDIKTKRALELSRYPGKNFEQVKEILEQTKRDEIDRCRRIYGEDFTDPKNYDLYFDTSFSPPDEAIEKILALQ